LGSTLMREAVTDAKGVFFDFHENQGGMLDLERKGLTT
jgi:hypothetical protein